MAAHVTTPTASSTGTATAKRKWLRLFGLLRRSHFIEHQAAAQAPPHPVRAGTSSIVGGDYEFVETEAWPRDITYLTSNIFAVTQPYLECAEIARVSNVNQDIVCDDSICFIGPRFGNRMKQQYELDLISTPVGLGVVCDLTIPKNAFIVEYVGEVLLGVDAWKRINRHYKFKLETKALWDGPTDAFVDAGRCGNESRFVNHDWRPNCSLFEMEWTNTARLGIFAKEDIPPLRELTICYRMAKTASPSTHSAL